MNQPLQTSTATEPRSTNLWLFGLFALAVALLIVIFRQGLSLMVAWWETPEYSHGYMIPLVAAFLLWQRINLLPARTERGSWWGVALLLGGLAAFFLGELSAIYTVVQYGFLISLCGVTLAFFGRRGMMLLWVVFAYLIFMIPLPNFLYFNLSSQLQLISSEIGVAVIRLFGISVHLEGNVIDLGPMQLQVAEACSGMRYLFPLMSFGFLIAYLYRGPFWQRALIFLTTVPITIFMNSFRIGVIGVTVDRWGKSMAEGFLHDFEGWVVFMGCLAILFLEISIFHLMSRDGKRALDRLNLDTPPLDIKLADFPLSTTRQRPFLVGLVLMALLAPALLSINERQETIPVRESFDRFPLQHNNWSGKTNRLEDAVLETLKLTDYIQANYVREDDGMPVNFYVAWYGSQKKGASIHSPRSCIPGGGWRIQSLEQRDLTSVQHVSGKPLRVNRAVIQKGDTSQVVYYWFEGRGRDVTNEYLAKWYIFWDSLTRTRSDGALVRLVTYVPDSSKLAAADEKLEEFARDFYPLLPTYTP
jgi:exosortase D (VPLPA-CTERM-specific)